MVDFVELSALPGDKRPQPGDDDQGEYAMHYTEAFGDHDPVDMVDRLSTDPEADLERYLELYKKSFGMHPGLEKLIRRAFTEQNPEKLPKMLADLESGDPQFPFHQEKRQDDPPRSYTEAAADKLREHVGRFMKVTLREEARNK